MPVSICDRSALRQALLGNSCLSENSRDRLDRQLVISARKVLSSQIEFEEAGTYQTNNIDALKRKYILLNTDARNTEEEEEETKAKVENGLEKGNKEVSLPEPKKILFPREAVQLGWSTNRRWSPGAGMVNVGNTCYLNSTLQALFHVPSLANWLLSDTEHSASCEDNGQGGCIICAMASVLHACQKSTGPIKPWLVYSKLRLLCRHLVPGNQEDAHEFLRYLVEGMEKSYLSRFKGSKDLDQYSKETTPLNHILGGYLRSTVKCLRCGHVSITFQHFQDLLLDVRKVSTLDEALESYFACESLEDMVYKCEGCQQKVSATKKFSLERFSSVLCIQLKRFSVMGNKINKHIEFSSTLDMSRFLCKKRNAPLTYRLVAMVTHIGASQNCGHYTAIGQASDGSYYQFDDSTVRPLPLGSVLATNAYIMFFELDKLSLSASHTMTPQGHTLKSVNNQHKFISLLKNNEKAKTFAPSLKPFSGNLEFAVTNGNESESKKGFIGPVMPVGFTNSQELGKNQSNDNTKSSNQQLIQKSPIQQLTQKSPNLQHTQKSSNVLHIQKSPNLLQIQKSPNLQNNHKSPGNPQTRLPIMNGSKLVKSSDNLTSPNKSMPILETDLPKKHSLISSGSLKNHNTVNGITSLKQNTNKLNVESVNKQIQMLKMNGQSNNVTTSNSVKSLVPYEGSDDSNQEGDLNNKKQEISITPGWKVSCTKNPAALSPSLNGKTGRSPKKKPASENENKSLKTSDSSDTVSQLLKMSHQGYAAQVSSWNGGRSHLEKEIAEERREQRKRPVDEMDQGRTKKVKTFHYQGRDNPGYNPFQEYQNSRQNQDQASRWHHHGRHYNNHHRNSYNSHRGAFNRGRHKPHNQRHGYYKKY